MLPSSIPATSQPANEPSDSTARPAKQSQPQLQNNNLLHYAAYFVSVGGLVFVAQSGEPSQIKDAVIAGAIASGSVISRDWFKAKLDPKLASDPSALISLFNEMLHAGRDQINTNAAHLKRVEFLQTDLVEAMRSFNDLLRLEPEAIAEQLQDFQQGGITSTNSMPEAFQQSNPAATNGAATGTYVPDTTTVKQSFRARRPGFDA